MKLAGHKTRSVFGYSIVSPRDLQDAAERLDGARQLQKQLQSVSTRLDTALGS
jgi:hypothetical protein